MSGGITGGQPGEVARHVIPRHPLEQAANAPGRRVDRVTQCGSCSADLDKKAFALCCRSCGASLVQDSDMTERARPDGLLRFGIDETTARAAFTTWVSSRHLAPQTLKATRQPQSIDGVFLPFWAFTTTTVTKYLGERGKTRHRQVARTRTNANGSTETYWESERYTDWSPAAGRVTLYFDDLLLPACSPLAAKIPPWPLRQLRPYQQGDVSGRRFVAYDIEPEAGFDDATTLTAKQIEQAVRADIGGDDQRVRDTQTHYPDPAYALLLLPAWLVSYTNGGRTWSALVNGATGEVVGDRPYSGAKISVLVGVLAAIVAATVAILALRH